MILEYCVNEILNVPRSVCKPYLRASYHVYKIGCLLVHGISLPAAQLFMIAIENIVCGQFNEEGAPQPAPPAPNGGAGRSDTDEGDPIPLSVCIAEDTTDPLCRSMTIYSSWKLPPIARMRGNGPSPPTPLLQNGAETKTARTRGAHPPHRTHQRRRRGGRHPARGRRQPRNFLPSRRRQQQQ